MGSALVSTGQSIEIIAITLAIYLTLNIAVSLFMNWYNRPSAGDPMTSPCQFAPTPVSTPLDAAITLVCLYIVWRISVPLVHWLLIDATWHGTSRDDCKGERRLLGVRGRARSASSSTASIRSRTLARRHGRGSGVLGATCCWGAARRIAARDVPASRVALPVIGVGLLHGGSGLSPGRVPRLGGDANCSFLRLRWRFRSASCWRSAAARG